MVSAILAPPFQASGIIQLRVDDVSLVLSLFRGVNVILDFPLWITHSFIPLPSATNSSFHVHPSLSTFGRDIRLGH